MAVSIVRPPPAEVVGGIAGKVGALHGNMTEDEVIAALGLSPWQDYLVFHSSGKGSVTFVRSFTITLQELTCRITLDIRPSTVTGSSERVGRVSVEYSKIMN